MIAKISTNCANICNCADLDHRWLIYLFVGNSFWFTTIVDILLGALSKGSRLKNEGSPHCTFCTHKMSCQTQIYLPRPCTERSLCFITYTPCWADVWQQLAKGYLQCCCRRCYCLGINSLSFRPLTISCVAWRRRRRRRRRLTQSYGFAYAVCLCINCSDILFKFEILLFAVRYKSWASALGPSPRVAVRPSVRPSDRPSFHPWANWLNLLLKAATRTQLDSCP